MIKLNGKLKKLHIKIKDYYPEKDILTTFECGRIINRDEFFIMKEIIDGKLVHIGNIKRIYQPLVFKRDFLNYTNQYLDCDIRSYKKQLNDILSNYPEELFDIHLNDILNIRYSNISYSFIMDNSIYLLPRYDNFKRKIVIRKDIFISFLITHRRLGYINNPIERTFIFPDMNENSNNINDYNIYIPNPDYENEELLKGNKIIRPFTNIKKNKNKEYNNRNIY